MSQDTESRQKRMITTLKKLELSKDIAVELSILTTKQQISMIVDDFSLIKGSVYRLRELKNKNYMRVCIEIIHWLIRLIQVP